MRVTPPTRRCLFAVLVAAACGMRAPRAAEVDAGEYSRDPDVIASGRTLFMQQCAGCHSLSMDAIGPPLGGVTSALRSAQLETWINDPAAVIASGDERANALLSRYKAQMPPFPHLGGGDVRSILAFIDSESRKRSLTLFEVGAANGPGPRILPPVAKSRLVVEVEDFVEIPRLPGRTPYKGITLLRPDPREARALLVDELMGLLYHVDSGRNVSVFLDIRPVYPDLLLEPGVASGLGSFALHPEFVRNGVFYTTHSELKRGNPAVNESDIPPDVPAYETPPLEWVLTEWRMNDPAAAVFDGTHREVMRFVTPTTGHAVQEIAFAPVGDTDDPDYAKLYICIGDGGSTNLKRPEMSGHPRTFLGSILRIDPAGSDGQNGRYGIPADNPFAAGGDPAARKEIWAYGFRNPHRVSWDFANPRRMFSVDIGESNVEEINIITPGGAYGYGLASLEGSFRLNARADAKIVYATTPAERATSIPPFGEYDHSEGTAITGGYLYRGPLQALRGKYIFGDIVSGRLMFMDVDAEPADHTIHEISLVRDGLVTSLKEIGHLARAHLRIGYDERTGDLFLLTKEDGMIRRVVSAYER